MSNSIIKFMGALSGVTNGDKKTIKLVQELIG